MAPRLTVGARRVYESRVPGDQLPLIDARLEVCLSDPNEVELEFERPHPTRRPQALLVTNSSSSSSSKSKAPPSAAMANHEGSEWFHLHLPSSPADVWSFMGDLVTHVLHDEPVTHMSKTFVAPAHKDLLYAPVRSAPRSTSFRDPDHLDPNAPMSGREKAFGQGTSRSSRTRSEPSRKSSILANGRASNREKSRDHRVIFSGADVAVQVTPYSEVYGTHPRNFDFDSAGNIVQSKDIAFNSSLGPTLARDRWSGGSV